ncbi:PepSY domain-containing protein [Microcoleus sp. LEGE 07076]|uniref:PepSY domain-containing protein n=1 Tax=Microcoleus sp. LEGE 07076 TaxID=915322 RepID=UPI0018820305|nr:PepSY domain-containing protein [Microcoleus sp. LEGE 07076]MBE9184467.1 PepSY domain-containing protein [Microcoleus sp. LEGE 07076]
MKTSTKIALVTALVGTLGLSALVRVYAAPAQSQIAVMPDRTSSKAAPEASDGDGEKNDDAEDKQASSRLQSLAKVTPQQARSAAEAAKGGTASRVKLENEDGNVVYSVAIGKQEIIVDAGNGKILYTQSPKDEGNKSVSPRSSVQFSEAAGGDGDGETNDDAKTK